MAEGQWMHSLQKKQTNKRKHRARPMILCVCRIRTWEKKRQIKLHSNAPVCVISSIHVWRKFCLPVCSFRTSSLPKRSCIRQVVGWLSTLLAFRYFHSACQFHMYFDCSLVTSAVQSCMAEKEAEEEEERKQKEEEEKQKAALLGGDKKGKLMLIFLLCLIMPMRCTV